MLQNKRTIIQWGLALWLFSLSAACTKFVQVGPPPTASPSETVFSNDAMATQAMLSIYGSMMSTPAFMSQKTSLDGGLAADELISYALPASKYYLNSLDPSTDDFWSVPYTYIYRVNDVINGLATVKGTSDSVNHLLTGEALFIRAFCHFYLVNLFGAVPYVNGTDYTVSGTAPRVPVEQIYPKIESDLLKAQALLGNGFPGANNKPGVERVRPNRVAVTALLARTYLYAKDWTNAEKQASSVLDSLGSTYQLLDNLDSVFLKNSKEAIWQLMPSVTSAPNGYEGATFILKAPPSIATSVTVSLTPSLYLSFEPGDKRQSHWVGILNSGTSTYYYPYKYKKAGGGIVIGGATTPASEYSMVLRLAEVYLIRAEARARLGNIDGAVSDLNRLRARARQTVTDLPGYTNDIGQDSCLSAVVHERQVELFTEWGHRWLDLKRMGLADQVLGPVKGSNWQTTDQLFPIPQTQLNLDPAMHGQQNPGY